jgi:hypothetical protein
MQTKSLNANLAKMQVGAVRWIEVPLDKSSAIVRRITAASRYPAQMKNWKFTCRTFTAIGSEKLGNIVYLLRIERVQ